MSLRTRSLMLITVNSDELYDLRCFHALACTKLIAVCIDLSVDIEAVYRTREDYATFSIKENVESISKYRNALFVNVRRSEEKYDTGKLVIATFSIREQVYSSFCYTCSSEAHFDNPFKAVDYLINSKAHGH